jgi:translation initiation factor IF-3
LAKKFYRINQYITADQVRVVDESGKQLGILTLKRALEKAQKAKVDLVEIAAKAQPPVCKLIDFKKFQYLEAKKQQGEKRATKKIEIKEIRLTPFIAQNDFNFRLRRAEEFLKQGHKINVFVHFQGRQLGKKEFGYELLEKAKLILSPYATLESEPKFTGHKLEMRMGSLKKEKNGKTKNENQKVA